MAVSALASTAFAQLGRELTQTKAEIRAVFPTDTILTSFLVAAPATLLTVLVLFSSDLTSDDVVCSTREIAHKMPISYSQGIADLNFINDYCHQNLIDYEVNHTTGAFLTNPKNGHLITTNMRNWITHL